MKRRKKARRRQMLIIFLNFILLAMNASIWIFSILGFWLVALLTFMISVFIVSMDIAIAIRMLKTIKS